LPLPSPRRPSRIPARVPTQSPAFNDTRAAFYRHVAAAACLGTTQALILFLPFLARLRFPASDSQTTVLTAAIPLRQSFSIFWNQHHARRPTPRYLLDLALLHSLPIGLIGAAPNIWAVMACYLVAAFGNAGMSPLNADLLRTCYPAHRRGRVFGIVLTSQM